MVVAVARADERGHMFTSLAGVAVYIMNNVCPTPLSSLLALTNTERN